MSPIAGAVYMGSTKNTFSHNTVHNFPHMGIWYRGNDNVIEYNDFYNGLKYCDDAESKRSWMFAPSVGMDVHLMDLSR